MILIDKLSLAPFGDVSKNFTPPSIISLNTRRSKTFIGLVSFKNNMLLFVLNKWHGLCFMLAKSCGGPVLH